MAKNVLKQARLRAEARRREFDAAKRDALVTAEGDKQVYRCAACHEQFEAAWSDEEALAETQQLFGDAPMPTSIVCDDCFEAMKRAGIFPS